MSNSESEPRTERAVAEMGALKLSVRIDGEWCPEVKWYTPDLPVFIAEDGTEVDIRDDSGILYESPDGAVEEIDEPTVDKEAKQVYEPMSHYGATVGDLLVGEDRETVEDWRDRLSDSNDGCANCGYSDRLGVVPYERDSK